MKALSIRQPWAWAICHAGKRIENREWNHVPSYRGPILIHAAKGLTFDEYMNGHDAIQVAKGWSTELACASIPSLKTMVRGAIVARARLDGVIQNDRDFAAYATMRGESQRPWWMGGLALILADVVPLAMPIPFKGTLGLFDVPGSILTGGDHG